MKLSVDTYALKLAIDSVKKQRSKDDWKPIMQGVAFRMEEDNVLRIETVDGYRIASAAINVAVNEAGDFIEGVYDLPKTLRLDTKALTTLEFTQKQLIIENGGLTIACRRIDGEPFDTAKIFPDESKIDREYAFNPKYLAEALSAMKNTSRESESVILKLQESEFAPVVLEFEKDGVRQKHLVMPKRT